MARKKAAHNLEEFSLEEVDELLRDEGVDIEYASDDEPVERIPTRVQEFDNITGGGFPRGRITEIFGPESSGKTLITLPAIAECQRMGGTVVFVDTEETFDPPWAAKHGVDLNKLRIARPLTGEQGYDLIEKYVRTGKVDLIVLDSIANMVPAAELMGEVSDQNIGLHARLNAKAMRRLNGWVSRSGTALVMINQTRSNVQPGSYNPTTTTGGRAIRFYATLRVSTRRIEWVRKGDEITGARFQAEIVKGKLTGVRPNGKATFAVDYEHGLDFAYDLLTFALDHGLVKKSGSWYTTADGERYQGEAAIKDAIRGNLDEWRERVLASS